ncbi:MAG: protein-glutamate O-methyltransferase CheR [Gammaproteobacteria bacterium]|nr:protein-glutamate O-methyltransferase CheR [Gammaproteobacteria bacterium]
MAEHYSYTAQPRLQQQEYCDLRDYLQKASGIVLGEGKEYLVSSRLGKLLREHRLDSFAELVRELNSGRNPRLRTLVVDAMTTNETFWFRDMAHFQLLTEVIMPERAAEPGAFRVWSAACSSGQEPYSLSMVMDDFRKKNIGYRRSVEITATDLSEQMLADAAKGLYCGMATVRGITPEQRKRYFVPRGDCFEVNPDLRRVISFRKQNLMDSFAGLGRFDVIFCRNVLIYFSAATKADVIARMAQSLKPRGYLLLGSTESLSDSQGNFEMVTGHGGIVYRRKT